MAMRSKSATIKLWQERERHRKKVPDIWFDYPVSKREARDTGITYYFTGEDCTKGHTSLRDAKYGNCLMCRGYKLIPPTDGNYTIDGIKTDGRNLYTKEEDEYLKNNYKHKSKAEMAQELGRSIKSIEKRLLSSLKLKIDYSTRDRIRVAENTSKNVNKRDKHRGKVPEEWFNYPPSRSVAAKTGAEYYFTGRPCNRGHIDVRGSIHHSCLACKREDSKEQRKTEEWKEWRRTHDKKPHVRQQELARRAERRATDPAYRFLKNASTRIANFFAGRQSAGKAEPCEVLIGCSREEFADWIYTQLGSKMEMEDYGLLRWHLDHVRPLTSFIEMGIDTRKEVQLVAFNWRNYQALWHTENRSKNDNWTMEMEEVWAKRMRALGWDGELFLCNEKD